MTTTNNKLSIKFMDGTHLKFTDEDGLTTDNIMHYKKLVQKNYMNYNATEIKLFKIGEGDELNHFKGEVELFCLIEPMATFENMDKTEFDINFEDINDADEILEFKNFDNLYLDNIDYEAEYNAVSTNYFISGDNGDSQAHLTTDIYKPVGNTHNCRNSEYFKITIQAVEEELEDGWGCKYTEIVVYADGFISAVDGCFSQEGDEDDCDINY